MDSATATPPRPRPAGDSCPPAALKASARPRGRLGAGAGGSAGDRLLDLARGRQLSGRQQQELLGRVRAAASADALLGLGLLCAADAARARQVVADAARARSLLLESFLDVAVEAAADHGESAATEPDGADRDRLLTAVVALLRALDRAAHARSASGPASGAADGAAGDSLRTALYAAVRAELSDPGSGQEVAHLLGVPPDKAGTARRTAGSAATGSGAAATVLTLRAAVIGERIDPFEHAVALLRFTAPGDTPLSLTEAAQVLGTSREAVRAVEARMLARLRRHPSAAAGGR